MASRTVFRDSRPSDAAALAADMRSVDVDELQAMNGKWADIEQILIEGIEQSAGTCWTAFLGNDLLMLGGAAPQRGSLLVTNVGVPWMLATRAMERRGGALTKAARRYLMLMHTRYPHLSNYVDARHAKSIAWLRRLGFTVSQQATPAGPYGLPFHSFWKEG